MEWDPLIIKQQARPEGYLNGIGIGCGGGRGNLVRCMHGQPVPYTLLLWSTSPTFDFQRRVAPAPFTSGTKMRPDGGSNEKEERKQTINSWDTTTPKVPNWAGEGGEGTSLRLPEWTQGTECADS